MSEMSEKAYRLGFDYEKTVRGCSQCSLAALMDAFGIRNDDILKAATGLAAGGGGATDGNCGAYSGAVMFLGYLCGRERKDFGSNSDAMHRNFTLVLKLREKFIEEYGSVICRDIQTKKFGRPFYLNDPDEFQKFEKAGAHETHCPDVVGKAARWTAGIIEKENLIPG